MKSAATLVQYAFTLALYFLGACLLAGALIPGALLFQELWRVFGPQTALARATVAAFAAGFGFFLFGITLALETVLLRLVLNLKLKPGEYPLFSAEVFKWAFVNAMMLIVKFTFMQFMKATPLLPLYYRGMGAKVGRGVQINTRDVGDISLIEIGDEAVLGGEAVVIGHLVEHGKMKLQKTRIGKRVTVGLGSVVMPGCDIGDGAMIAARSVLPKFTQVPARALFAGTPAVFVKQLQVLAFFCLLCGPAWAACETQQAAMEAAQERLKTATRQMSRAYEYGQKQRWQDERRFPDRDSALEWTHSRDFFGDNMDGYFSARERRAAWKEWKEMKAAYEACAKAGV
jgi:carbonic anhydrase/acetyltransferase-like protein (isoleucine patch superfamily)